jgi:4-amino-4-deoxy-L-arabinose transferase-like glycosyltransferase
MTRKSFLIVTVIVLLTGILGWLGYLGLRAEEPRRAIVSVEMMMDGDYIMPHLLGWPYYNKPPLFNWVMIPFFKLFGSINEWAVRLPSALSLLLLAFLNWKMTRKFIHPEVALLSSLFLLASADILFYGSVNTGEIDIFYALLVYLNIIAIYIFLERKEYLWLFIISYFLAALGFLTKGLPSIAFQGLTLVTGLLYFKTFRTFFSWKHLLGITIFVILAGGYMIIIYQRGELSGFLIRQVKESAQRTGIESDIMTMLKGLIENPASLLKISLPWSLAVVGFLSKQLRKKVLGNRLVVFSLLAVAVNFPLYWITGEYRARYVYPLIPFLCILYASLIHHGYEKIRGFKSVIDKGLPPILSLLPMVLIVAFFIPSLQMNILNHLLNGILIAAGVVLIIYFMQNKMLRIYAVVLFMGLSRIAMNNIYLKLYDAESQTTDLRNHVSRMVEIAGDQKIDMTGSPYVYNSTIKFLGGDYMKGEVVVPMILSYQVPYYYALYTDSAIRFDRDPKPGNLYLIIEQDLYKYKGEVLYSYLDASTRNNWNLVRITAPAPGK